MGSLTYCTAQCQVARYDPRVRGAYGPLRILWVPIEACSRTMTVLPKGW